MSFVIRADEFYMEEITMALVIGRARYVFFNRYLEQSMEGSGNNLNFPSHDFSCQPNKPC